ncbi:MAG: hypothetical protein RL355_283 [Actinomycetota bacterium]
MSVHRIMGIETEFGIASPGNPNANPMIMSSQVVNAYADLTMPNRIKRMRWDYDVESPLRDARGFDMSRADADPSQLTNEDYGMANVVLTNGARFYVDHAHPEYSSPEVTNPLDCALWDAAGDRIMQISAEHASKLTGELFTAYKNNTDGKGVSYGTHENYQLDRATPFGRIVEYLTPFFVTRSVFAGAGRVGLGQESHRPGFQISQRADFFEAEIGLETTLRRPIINTRDEPHADPDKYRRLHVIVGDANMSQFANYLKLGSTSLVLSMIEDDYLKVDLQLHDPVSNMHMVSHDYEFKERLTKRNGQEISALDIQEIYIEHAEKYVIEREKNDPMTMDVLGHWRRVVDTLRTDPMSLSNELDWVAKFNIMDAYRKRDNALWNDPRIETVDIQYADLRPSKGLALTLQAKGRLKTIFTEEQIQSAIVNPPTDTRAYFRGNCVGAYEEQIAAASWDSIIFDFGIQEPMVRLNTVDARKGTKELTGSLFEKKLSAQDFVSALTGN